MQMYRMGIPGPVIIVKRNRYDQEMKPCLIFYKRNLTI